jgi:hypothetical protein
VVVLVDLIVSYFAALRLIGWLEELVVAVVVVVLLQRAEAAAVA